MSRYSMLLIALLGLPFLQSCMTTPPPLPVERKDPLIGTIIDAKTQNKVDFSSLINTIADYDVIYLSEKHDNADQHAAQNTIIKALSDKLSPENKKPSVGFEFFSMNHTPDLLNFIDAGKVEHSKKVEDLIEKDLRMKLGWQRQSDTWWNYYYSLLKTAQKEGLMVAGLDLSSTIKKRLTKKGLKGITPLEQEQIYSTGLDDITYKNYMYEILKASHCGMGYGKKTNNMYETWVARNDRMALSIKQMHDHSPGPVIVIVGGGHTEYGLGVIDRVKSINPNIRQINIALTEIWVEPAGLDDYLEPLNLEGYPRVPKGDILWFFQRTSYEDPCEKYKPLIEKMKKKQTKD